MKLQTIQNFLDNLKGYNPELKPYHLEQSDSRVGRRVALAIRSDMSLDVKTDFYTYEGMYIFLMGYKLKSEKRL
jgi:hypothetical protein